MESTSHWRDGLELHLSPNIQLASFLSIPVCTQPTTVFTHRNSIIWVFL